MSFRSLRGFGCKASSPANILLAKTFATKWNHYYFDWRPASVFPDIRKELSSVTNFAVQQRIAELGDIDVSVAHRIRR
jgi:hypothetical protein